jgi:hypothetical protein
MQERLVGLPCASSVEGGCQPQRVLASPCTVLDELSCNATRNFVRITTKLGYDHVGSPLLR